MGYKVKRLGKEPIIIVTWIDPADPVAEGPRMCKEVDALIGTDEKVWNIQDMRELKLNFSMVVRGMSQASMNIPGSPRDPRCKNILIGTGILWDMVVRGAKKMQFGGLDVVMCSSTEEAITHAREADKK